MKTVALLPPLLLALIVPLPPSSTPLSCLLQLTPKCLELLNAMLMPDPAKRITLEGIMKHEWFLENLPPGGWGARGRGGGIATAALATDLPQCRFSPTPPMSRADVWA